MAIYGASGSIGAWCSYRPHDGSSQDSYNISSVTDHAQGDWTFTINGDFDNNDYVVLATATPGNGRHCSIRTNDMNDTEANQTISTYSAGACRMVLVDGNNGKNDCTLYNVAFIGDK